MAGETKYHINPHTGRAGVCRAHKRPCEFGGDSGKENHYNFKAEAEKAIMDKLSATNSAIPKAASKSGTNASKNTTEDAIRHERLLSNVKRSVEKNDELLQDSKFEYNELVKNKNDLLVLRDSSSLAIQEDLNSAINKIDDEIEQSLKEYRELFLHARDYKERYKEEIKELKKIEREKAREEEAKRRTEQAKSYARQVDNSSCGSSRKIGPNEMRAMGRASARSSCGGSGGGRPSSSC